MFTRYFANISHSKNVGTFSRSFWILCKISACVLTPITKLQHLASLDPRTARNVHCIETDFTIEYWYAVHGIDPWWCIVLSRTCPGEFLCGATDTSQWVQAQITLSSCYAH